MAAVVVDAGYLTPQLNRRNDRLRVEAGPLNRSEPLRLRPLASIERWDRATINWMPVVGANTSDKFMLGAAFYNSPLAPKRLQYLAMPMYSFNRNELNGIGKLQLTVMPSKFARQLVTAVTVQRFERYLKIEPSFTFVVPRTVGSALQRRLTLALTAVQDQDQDRTSSIITGDYRIFRESALQGWNAHVEINSLLANDFATKSALLLRADATYHRYYSLKKQVQVRVFGGRFLQSASQSDFVIGLSGSPDYRRQTAFLDRQQISPALAAQRHQTDDRDGAFKSFLPVYSTNWLSTLNVQADVPGLNLAVFADLGATSAAYQLPGRTTTQRLFYDAGLALPLFNNVLQFYIPVAGSQFKNGLPESHQDFTDGIRFVLNLNTLNPFKLLDEGLGK